MPLRTFIINLFCLKVYFSNVPMGQHFPLSLTFNYILPKASFSVFQSIYMSRLPWPSTCSQEVYDQYCVQVTNTCQCF